VYYPGALLGHMGELMANAAQPLGGMCREVMTGKVNVIADGDGLGPHTLGQTASNRYAHVCKVLPKSLFHPLLYLFGQHMVCARANSGAAVGTDLSLTVETAIALSTVD
jgi:hypothetical protein